MADKQKLRDYRAERDLRRSPEPSGWRHRDGGGRPRFVVHKHDASTLLGHRYPSFTVDDSG